MLETCCDILNEAYQRGWITSRDGNLSIRFAEHDYFHITPSGVRKQKIQYDMFKKVKLIQNYPFEPTVIKSLSQGFFSYFGVS